MAEVKVGPTMHVIYLYFQKVHIATWTFWKFKYITKVLQLHKYAIIKVVPMNMIFLVFNFLEIQIILNTVTQSSGSQIAAKGMTEVQVQIQMHVINILCPSAITVKFAEEFRDEEVD